MKISISQEVLSKFPNIVEGIVVARNVNIETPRSREIIEMLRGAENELRRKYSGVDLNKQPTITVWDEIYASVSGESDLTVKEKERMLPSHKNLALRVLSGGKIPNINPLVNYYNSLSLKYLLPFGAEDLSGYYGDLMLSVADGSELFLEIGGDKVVTAARGEVVWKDAHSVSCRMWAWRQSERTKITKSTTDLIVVVDTVDDDGVIINAAKQSIDEVASGLVKYFGATVDKYYLQKDNPLVTINIDSKDPVSISGTVNNHLEGMVTKKVVGSKGIRKRKPDSLGFLPDRSLLTDLSVALRRYFPDDIGDLGLAYSPDGHTGDVSSSVAFRYSTKVSTTPSEAANKLVSEAIEQMQLLGATECPFTQMTAAENGFINLEISPAFLLTQVRSALNNVDEFGKSGAGAGRRMLVESPGWNPNKTPHVGHMLNILLGKALIRTFEHVGLEALNDDIINDKGLPVMQTLWAYQKFADGASPESTGDKPDHFVHRYYTIGKKKYNEDPEVQAAVKEILQKWEAGDKTIRVLWERLVNWAYAGQKQTIERIWEEPGYAWYESDVYKGGKEIVQEKLGKGVLEKLDDGAVIARIEQEYGLPDTVVLKSDGTGLYHTQDMHLTVRKKEKFEPWKIIWVVGEEQIAHFQRLFAILDALDIMPIDNLYHYAYSVVVGKDGNKLSSRDGSELSADDLMDQMQERAAAILMERSEGMSEAKVVEISEAVAIGALKYSLLSRDPFKQIKFDVEESLSFTGKSGPYIMYSYTRARNIEKKVEIQYEISDLNPNVFRGVLTAEVRKLVVQLLRYPEVVVQTANNYSPGILAEYLFDLAKAFNNFYENVKVVDASPEQQKVLLLIVSILMHVLKDGLEILGIKTLEEM